MAALSIAQQFGAVAGDALRQRLPGLQVVDTAPGPQGWRADTQALLAAPTPAWGGQPRPEGWPGQLRWVQLPSTGIDGYPDWLFDAPGVMTAPGLNAPAIAEFVIATLLAHEKRLPGVWIRRAEDWQPATMGSLQGRTLGLAGIGAIGSAIARHALGFGMKVVAWRRSRGSPMEGVDVVADVLSLASMADHLVLCLPSTPVTRGMVDARFLQACKPGVHLVNVARGDLIDQEALVAALDNGTVGLASLDVTEPEPLPAGHPLYTHPRVHLSPHIAWKSADALPRLLNLFADQIARVTAGLDPHHRTKRQAATDESH